MMVTGDPMPLIDIYYPAGSIDPADAQVLADRVAALVRAEEGFADSRLAAALSWVYLHAMPDFTVTRSGAAPSRPLWRVEVTAPADLLAPGRRRAVAKGIAEAVLAVEGTPGADDEGLRIWTLFRDVPAGCWFAGERPANARTVRSAVARERAVAV